MIDIKSAIRIAIKYLQELQEFIPAQSIRLEETEYDEAADWLITLSTLSSDDPASFVEHATPSLRTLFPGKRIYKQFRIDAETGKVKSMKVRSLEPVE